jgi:hypothetical protein
MKDEFKIEKIKEEINYRIELIKILAIFFLTAIGGEISIFLKGFNLKTLIVFILGIPIVVLLGVLLWVQHNKIFKLLNSLEEKDV